MKHYSNEQVQPGDVVDFFHQDQIHSGICTRRKNKRIHVLTQITREMPISLRRVIHSSPGIFSLDITSAKMLLQLKELSKRRETLSQKLKLNELWALVNAEGSKLSLRELAELAFTGECSVDHEAALNRAVYRQKIYFIRQKDNVLIQTEEHVEKEIDRAEKLKRKKQEILELYKWLNAKSEGKHVPDPEDKDRLIKALIAFAVNNQEHKDRPWIKEILKKSNLSSPDDVTEFLIQIGLFDPDENLELIRFEFPEKHSSYCMSELQSLANQPNTDSQSKRTNLTNLNSFTVDNSKTKDMDDAISFEQKDNGSIVIGIHITDLSDLVPPGSFLDQEAQERSQTLYMPDQTINMFPSVLSEDIASLKAGEDRNVITTLVTFDSENNICESSIIPAIIHVRQRMNYDNMNTLLDESVFNRLLSAAQTLRKQRSKSGAVAMPHPELSIEVDSEKNITISKRSRETPAQLIVSELMILTNQLAAKMAKTENCAFPFRLQKPPDETIPVSAKIFDPLVVDQQRKVMHRVETSIHPEPHYSLGLSSYTNVTSPLRRYFDLVAQYQLKSILGLENPYTPNELRTILYEIETIYARTNIIISSSNRYWLLKYLQQRTGQSTSAVILDKNPRQYRVWLTEYCINHDMLIPFGVNLHPGEEIKVIIEQSDPRKNILKLRYLD